MCALAHGSHWEVTLKIQALGVFRSVDKKGQEGPQNTTCNLCSLCITAGGSVQFRTQTGMARGQRGRGGSKFLGFWLSMQ